MLYLKYTIFFLCIKYCKFILFVTLIFIINTIFFSKFSYSEIKNSINGSGLQIPRMVSLKNSLTFVRTGPGKEFPIKFEINQKGYPVEIIAEFNNWRKINTKNNLSGWIHTQLLSSFRTALLITNTTLKRRPSDSSKNLAKLLPDLLIQIKTCKLKWCNIEIIREKKFLGWVKKNTLWGSIIK